MLQKYSHWLPVVLWMGFIFTMSTGFGTAEHTSRYIEPLLRWMLPHATDDAIGLGHFLIRKCGHLSEYAVLALLVRRAIDKTPQPANAMSPLRATIIALTICAAYAATDELHQVFVPGRTPELTDVLIDSCGAFAALAVATIRTGRRERPA